MNSKYPLPPDAGAEHLRLVQIYKHLGSYIRADGSPAPDVPHRIRSAMSAYAPLAVKVFGSTAVVINVRINLASSLVLARLLLNTQAWTSWSASLYRPLTRYTCVLGGEL